AMCSGVNAGFTEQYPVGAHRASDVLDLLFAHVFERDLKLVAYLVPSRAAGADATRASSGVQTIGSPLTLKLVFTRTGQPERALNAVSRAWYRGLVSACRVWVRAE